MFRLNGYRPTLIIYGNEKTKTSLNVERFLGPTSIVL